MTLFAISGLLFFEIESEPVPDFLTTVNQWLYLPKRLTS
jgi:hypothetical protein